MTSEAKEGYSTESVKRGELKTAIKVADLAAGTKSGLALSHVAFMERSDYRKKYAGCK
jgi:hypothetical protein